MKPGRSTIAGIFIAAALLLVGSVLCTYLVGLVTIRSNGRVAESRAILQHLNQLVSALRDAETAQRLYLLTGDEHSLKPYSRALGQVQAERSALQDLVSQGELSTNSVLAVDQLIRQKTTELDQSVQVRRDSDFEPALSLVRAEEGKGTMEHLNAELSRLELAQRQLLEQAMRRAQTADAWRTTIFIATIAFNLIFLGWAFRRLTREAGLREQAAWESNRQRELLATTLASIGDGVIASDAQERLTFLNPEAERLTGWSNHQAVGRPLAEVFNAFEERTQKPLTCEAHNGNGSGTLTRSAILQTLNGDRVQVSATVSPIRQANGSSEGKVLVFRDVSEELRNQQVRARLAAIVESSGDAIISENLDGRIQSWNSGAERVFRYSIGEVLGKSTSILVPASQLEQEQKALARIRGGSLAEKFETQRLAKGGQMVPVLVTLSPLKDAEGKVIGTSRIIRDITDLVIAREALARGKQEMEKLVQARTARLREMIQELQHISYAITHDMRAPLRAMGAFAQMLLDEASAANPSNHSVEYCHRIMTAAARLDTLIRDALSFTGTVLQEAPLHPVDLFVLVRGIIDTYPSLHSTDADVRIDGMLPTVLGNESLLTQCFANLLDNAVKFVAPGVRPEVRVWAESNGSFERVWIEDNGIGIAKHAHSRLFRMFQKLDNQYAGNGVGLAIVRKVTHHMGGRVGVDSDLGQGSRFWVELPSISTTVERSGVNAETSAG